MVKTATSLQYNIFFKEFNKIARVEIVFVGHHLVCREVTLCVTIECKVDFRGCNEEYMKRQNRPQMTRIHPG